MVSLSLFFWSGLNSERSEAFRKRFAQAGSYYMLLRVNELLQSIAWRKASDFRWISVGLDLNRHTRNYQKPTASERGLIEAFVSPWRHVRTRARRSAARRA
jgi:hypothetical protein